MDPSSARTIFFAIAVALLALPPAQAEIVNMHIFFDGPSAAGAGETKTYCGQLIYVEYEDPWHEAPPQGPGLPGQPVEILREGEPAATALTDLDGRFCGDVTLPTAGVWTIQAAAYRGTLQELRSDAITIVIPDAVSAGLNGYFLCYAEGAFTNCVGAEGETARIELPSGGPYTMYAHPRGSVTALGEPAPGVPVDVAVIADEETRTARTHSWWNGAYRARVGPFAFGAVAPGACGVKTLDVEASAASLSALGHGEVSGCAVPPAEMATVAWRGRKGAVEMKLSPDAAVLYAAGGSSTAAFETSSGAPLWSSSGRRAAALGMSADGSTLAITSDSLVTVAYDSLTGVERWAAPGSAYFAGGVAVTSDGSRVLVSGYDGQLVTRAFDGATGAMVWEARRAGASAYEVTLSPDGQTLLVAAASGSAMMVVAYDVATGTERWAGSAQGSRTPNIPWGGLSASPDGTRVFVTGESGYPEWNDYFTAAFDAGNGALLWSRSYDGLGGAADDASDVAVSPDGANVYVTGRSREDASNGLDYATIAYDAMTGNERWVARFSGAAPGEPDWARAVAVAPDGMHLYVTGSTLSARQSMMTTLSLDTQSGRLEWVQRHAAGGFGAWSMALSPDGSRLFVSGAGSGETLVAYDLTTIP